MTVFKNGASNVKETDLRTLESIFTIQQEPSLKQSSSAFAKKYGIIIFKYVLDIYTYPFQQW